MPARRLLPILAALALAATALAGCAPVQSARGVLGRWAQDERALPFYEIGDVAPAAPGSIVRTQELDGPPRGSRAWRMLYHSRDQDDRDIVVSGIVVIPTGAAPAGGRTVVSRAHPTTGVAPGCAPSLTIGGTSLIAGLADLIAAGGAVRRRCSPRRRCGTTPRSCACGPSPRPRRRATSPRCCATTPTTSPA